MAGVIVVMCWMGEEKESWGISLAGGKGCENKEVRGGKLNVHELCTWPWHAMSVSL